MANSCIKLQFCFFSLLAVGMVFLLSPISSILVDKIGIRKTAFTGGLIATLGMFLSSYAVEKVSEIFLLETKGKGSQSW